MDSGCVGVVDLATKSVRRMKVQHDSVSLITVNLVCSPDGPGPLGLRGCKVHPRSPQRTH